MKVQYGDSVFNVSWRYVSEWTTQCAVEDSECSLGLGVATRSLRDQPCKETARKVSLRRAMLPFSRDFRTAVWKAYFNRKVSQ